MHKTILFKLPLALKQIFQNFQLDPQQKIYTTRLRCTVPDSSAREKKIKLDSLLLLRLVAGKVGMVLGWSEYPTVFQSEVTTLCIHKIFRSYTACEALSTGPSHSWTLRELLRQKKTRKLTLEDSLKKSAGLLVYLKFQVNSTMFWYKQVVYAQYSICDMLTLEINHC